MKSEKKILNEQTRTLKGINTHSTDSKKSKNQKITLVKCIKNDYNKDNNHKNHNNLSKFIKIKNDRFGPKMIKFKTSGDEKNHDYTFLRFSQFIVRDQKFPENFQKWAKKGLESNDLGTFTK